jgi:hypothetical protein
MEPLRRPEQFDDEFAAMRKQVARRRAASGENR